MEKINMEEIFKSATISVFHEHMKDAEKIAIKIAEILVENNISCCVIALAIVKGTLIGSVPEEDLHTIHKLKELMENVSVHCEKVYRDCLKENPCKHRDEDENC